MPLKIYYVTRFYAKKKYYLTILQHKKPKNDLQEIPEKLAAGTSHLNRIARRFRCCVPHGEKRTNEADSILLSEILTYTYVRALRKSKEQTQPSAEKFQTMKQKRKRERKKAGIFRDDALMVHSVAQTRNIMREEIAVSVETLPGQSEVAVSQATWRRGTET